MSRLRVRAYRDTFIKVSDRQLTAIGDGIRASGDDFDFTGNLQEDADVALVVSGPKFPGSRIGNAREEIHKRYVGRMVTCETPFFRRGAQPHDGDDPYFRLSVGGFMRDDGTFHPPGFEPDGERWAHISREQGIHVSPWKLSGKGKYILVCMQKPSDASLRGMSVKKWTPEIVSRIRNVTRTPIVIRPHPLARSRDEVTIDCDDCTWSSNESLAYDLADARAMVTYSSLSAIESVIDGVPTFCCDPGNHAWPVSLKDNIGLLAKTKLIEHAVFRTGWLWSLAWSQWRLSELREGGPWRRLRPMLT